MKDPPDKAHSFNKGSFHPKRAKKNLSGLVFDSLMNTDTDSIYIKDRSGRFLRVNRSLLNELDISDEREIVGKTDRDLFGEDICRQRELAERELYETGDAVEDLVEKRNDCQNQVFWTITTKIPLKNQNGEIIGLIGVSRNISQFKSTETHLRNLATHDNLTNVYNRLGLFERLEEMTRPSEKKMAVLLLDIDNFKRINDQYFHKTGDEFLKWLAWLLKSTTRGNDIVARVGGDEFVLILDNLNHQEDVRSFYHKLYRNFEDSLDDRFRALGVGISIGVSLFPDDSMDPEQLIEQADVSLYHVKQHQKGNIEFFQNI